MSKPSQHAVEAAESLFKRWIKTSSAGKETAILMVATEIQLATDKVTASLGKERDEARAALDRQRENYIKLCNAVLGEGCSTSDMKDIAAIAKDHRERLEKAEARVEELQIVNSDFDKTVAEVATFKANDLSIDKYYEMQSQVENTEAACAKMRQPLADMLFFCEDYLKSHTHPGVSRLVSDAKEALGTPPDGN